MSKDGLTGVEETMAPDLPSPLPPSGSTWILQDTRGQRNRFLLLGTVGLPLGVGLAYAVSVILGIRGFVTWQSTLVALGVAGAGLVWAYGRSVPQRVRLDDAGITIGCWFSTRFLAKSEVRMVAVHGTWTLGVPADRIRLFRRSHGSRAIRFLWVADCTLETGLAAEARFGLQIEHPS